MSKVYIVLTYTGTILSKIIKTYTKDEFSHASISLDEDLTEMYSFGRLNPYNPFYGGFVHEAINKGTFKRFKKTYAKIFSLDILPEQYDIIKENINKIKNNKDKYTFNIWGLFAIGFNKRIAKEGSFYCAEFVKYILEKSNIELSLPDMVRPENFKDLDMLNEIYSGRLRDYRRSKKVLGNALSREYSCIRS